MRKYNAGNVFVPVLILALIAGIGTFIYGSVSSNLSTRNQSAQVIGGSGSGTNNPISASLRVTNANGVDITTVNSGDSVYLTWNSQNATQCTVAVGSLTETYNGLNNSMVKTQPVLFNPNAATINSITIAGDSFRYTNRTFKINCSNATNGFDSVPILIKVLEKNTPPPPTITANISINPTSGTHGDYATLTMSSSNSTSCKLNGSAIPPLKTQPTTQQVQLLNSGNSTITQSFVLQCTGANSTSAEATASATVAPTSKPKVSVSMRVTDANDADITSGTNGDKVLIKITPVNATRCTASGLPYVDTQDVGTNSKALNITLLNTSTSQITQEFKVTCNGAGGDTASDSKKVTINPTDTSKKPKVELSVEIDGKTYTKADLKKLAFDAGKNARFHWDITQEDSNDPTKKCSGAGFQTGGDDVDNNKNVSAYKSVPIMLTRTNDFAVTCQTNSGYQFSDKLNITVDSRPNILQFFATELDKNDKEVKDIKNSDTITYGDSVKLSWLSSKARKCTGYNFDTQDQTSSLRTPTVVKNITKDTNFTLTCVGWAGEQTSNTIFVKVKPLPVVKVWAVDAGGKTITQVDLGQTVELKWSAPYANSCKSSDFTIHGSGAETLSPSVTNPAMVTIAKTTTFRITCSGDSGEVSAETTVNAGDMSVSLTINDDIVPANKVLVQNGKSVVGKDGKPVMLGQATLSWSVKNVDIKNCIASNFTETGDVQLTKDSKLTQAMRTVTLKNMKPDLYMFFIQCTSPSGLKKTAKAITEVMLPVKVTLTKSNDINIKNFRPGDPAPSSKLSWIIENSELKSSVKKIVSVCSSTGFKIGTSKSGSVNVSPEKSTQYSILCTGPANTATASVTVNVR